MEGERLLRLAPSAALKGKRLAELAGRAPEEAARARRAVDEACLNGSLELLSSPSTAEAEGLRRAFSLRPEGAFTVGALLAWHAAATGSQSGLRTAPRERASPPDLVRGRLENLEGWLDGGSGAELGAAERGALVLARLAEIVPFEEANGRVARLAASHAMVQAGAHPPLLVGSDRERIDACLEAAFQLQTLPLVQLLEEASERALDLSLRLLDGKGP